MARKPGRRSAILTIWEVTGGLLTLGLSYLLVWWMVGDPGDAAWALAWYSPIPFILGLWLAERLAETLTRAVNDWKTPTTTT